MSTEKSKMPVSRQIRYFRESRDNLKEKAAKKQEKIREYEQTIRVLKVSREKWKKRAIEAEKRVKELEKESEKRDRKKSKTQKFQEEKKLIENSLKVQGHHYTIQTIQISMQQVMEAGSSYRGVATTLKILSSYFYLESPHHSSIRKWLGRIGLYELNRQKEKREDWIYIIDLTLELGREKALVIYGIPEQLWQSKVLKEGRGLRHTDGEILGIEVTESATGEWIQEILEKLMQSVGIPVQIVSDHGSNLKKGIELTLKNHPEVIYTYDVTHGMANLLKKELVSSETYQKFLVNCHQCRQQLQQTEFAFIAPPSQRSQCRYFNVERLVNWGISLLNCPLDILFSLASQIETDLSKKRLIDKFGWLINYQEHLALWQLMVQMTRQIEKQLKIFGLNQQSQSQLVEKFSPLTIPEQLEPFQHKIFNYLKSEMNRLKEQQTILATSDVLESIFGKYKHFSKRCPLKDLRQMLLTIPLSTMNLTSDVIKKALETVHSIDLSQWLNQAFGESMLSKRKTVFSASFFDIKTA